MIILKNHFSSKKILLFLISFLGLFIIYILFYVVSKPYEEVNNQILLYFINQRFEIRNGTYSHYESKFNTKLVAQSIVLRPKRSGVRGVSAIYNDKYRIIMCTVPKVGSSSWREFMLYLQYPEIATRSGYSRYVSEHTAALKSSKYIDPHAIARNGVKLIASLPEKEALQYYQNASYLKVFELLLTYLKKNSYFLMT